MANPNRKLLSKKIKEKWKNPEYRAKMIEALRGRIFSTEARLHMGQSRIGKKRPGVGIKIARALKGQRLSEETKKKISDAHKKLWASGYKKPIQATIKQGEAISGARNPNWKGGLTPLNKMIRKCFEYRQWRSDIFTRDDFTCQICIIKGGKIVADHIKAFSIILYENKIKTMEEALNCEELWNINNGRTLCCLCHLTYGWNLFKTENNPNNYRYKSLSK